MRNRRLPEGMDMIVLQIREELLDPLSTVGEHAKKSAMGAELKKYSGRLNALCNEIDRAMDRFLDKKYMGGKPEVFGVELKLRKLLAMLPKAENFKEGAALHEGLNELADDLRGKSSVRLVQVSDWKKLLDKAREASSKL